MAVSDFIAPPAHLSHWVRSHRAPLLAVPAILAVAAGIYAAAAASASILAASFSTEEALRHAQAVRFEDATIRAPSDWGTTRIRCAELARMERDDCVAAAGRDERIAIRGAI